MPRPGVVGVLLAAHNRLALERDLVLTACPFVCRVEIEVRAGLPSGFAQA